MLKSTRTPKGRSRSPHTRATPQGGAPAASRSRGKRRGPEKLSFSPTDEDITPEVMEFIEAIGHYKRENNRPFPTWSEILKILRGMGYRRG